MNAVIMSMKNHAIMFVCAGELDTPSAIGTEGLNHLQEDEAGKNINLKHKMNKMRTFWGL